MRDGRTDPDCDEKIHVNAPESHIYSMGISHARSFQIDVYENSYDI